MHKWQNDVPVKMHSAFVMSRTVIFGFGEELHQAMAKLKVLVLFGGTSIEYDESRKSAVAVLNALPSDQYEIIPVGINKKGRWLYFPGDCAEIAADTWDQSPDCSSAVLSPDPAHRGILILEDTEYSLKRVDVIFSLLHGQFGEDGAVQGLFELSHIPYVGNGILGSALCRSKVYTHLLLNHAGIPTPNWTSVEQRNLNRLDRECERIEAALEFPLYVKPSRSDSSAASRIVRNHDELAAAIKLAFTRDTQVLVEEYIEGREFRVGVFGYDLPFASFVGEIIHENNGKTLLIPADLDDSIASVMRQTAIEAFCALDCKEIALLDLYHSARGDFLIGEVNTMPALSEDASYPRLMADLGMRYPYLLEKLIQQAMEHADRGM